jgi:hypothetical protein
MEELIISTGYPRFWMEQLSPQVTLVQIKV